MKYTVSLHQKDYETMPTTVSGIEATTEEEAIEKAKIFAAQNGYWGGVISFKGRLKRLVIDQVVEEKE